MQSPDNPAGAVADAQRGNWVDRYRARLAEALCAAGALGPADRLLAAVLAVRLRAGAGGARQPGRRLRPAGRWC